MPSKQNSRCKSFDKTCVVRIRQKVRPEALKTLFQSLWPCIQTKLTDGWTQWCFKSIIQTEAFRMWLVLILQTWHSYVCHKNSKGTISKISTWMRIHAPRCKPSHTRIKCIKQIENSKTPTSCDNTLAQSLNQQSARMCSWYLAAKKQWLHKLI